MHPYRRSLVLGLAPVAIALTGGTSAPLAQPMSPQEAEPDRPSASLRPPTTCPADLDRLAPQLLHDLPDYANRVAIRNLDLSRRPVEPVGTILTVSAPDLTPIELAELAEPAPGPGASDPTTFLQQIFFTTLERQYLADQTVSLQHHHWLFLASTAEGWRLALLYSSLAPYPTEAGTRPPTPPQESSDGIVGQAVRLWLRDCRAGAIFPPAADPEDRPSPGATTP